jgi:uncharacterized protein (TIGR02118 family)
MTAKVRYLFIRLALILLVGCKTGQVKYSSLPTPGLFKVTILYPNGEGKTFDLDYYEKKHMPMVAGYIGKNLKFYEIDKGVAGRTPDDKIPYLAIGYFYITDLAEYNKSISQHIDTILGDFKNYTNIQPVIQISELKRIEYIELK